MTARCSCDVSELCNSLMLHFLLLETPSPNVLSIYAIESKPLSKWFSPGELPLTPPPLAVLKRQAKETSDLVLQLETSYRMEKSNLERYDEVGGHL